MGIFKIIKWVFKLLTGRRGLSLAGLGGGALASLATGLLGKGGGSLSGLLEKLSGAGLGSEVQSWVGKGKNLPVSTEQVTAALGDEVISDAAQKTGLSTDATASAIASILPELINKLTPKGQVPDEQTVAKRLEKLLK